MAEPHHLFEALDEAAVEDNALSQYGNITIDSYFRSWSEKAGHPLLTVNISQETGEMTVTQVRVCFDYFLLALHHSLIYFTICKLIVT